MATTVVGSGRLYLAPNASLGTSFGTHTVEEVTITQSGEAPVESQVAGSYALIAVKDASKAELSVTFLTNATVTIPAIGTAHTFDHMPEVEIFATPDGINDTSTTGKWTLTEVTNPVAYDQVQRCTATFTKWSGKKRT